MKTKKTRPQGNVRFDGAVKMNVDGADKLMVQKAKAYRMIWDGGLDPMNN